MCKPDLAAKTSKVPADVFATKPSLGTMANYSVVTIAVLVAIEYSLRYLFSQYKHLHPILENETNRLILARHIGTDAFCCGIVAAMGMMYFRTVCPGFLDAAFGKQGAVPKAGFEARLFMYQPEAFKICLFFACYQIKNTYDTILWNDGAVFIAHHVMTLAVAYGAIFHGVAHYYAPFFFGVSEISTAVLCLLANFDDAHGVPGLADAWPEGKVIFGALFAVAFIVCRVFLWTFISYYFVVDALLAINKTDSTRDAARPWVKVLFYSHIGLSALQVIWLGQIILVATEEIQKLTA